MSFPSHLPPIELPDGYTMRSGTIDDAQAVVGIMNAWSVSIGGTAYVIVEDIISDWSHPDFNLETNLMMVENVDKGIIGYIEIWDAEKPPVSLYGDVKLHPDHQDMDLGLTLVSWTNERGKQVFPQCPPDTRVVFLTTVTKGDDFKKNLLTKAGFQAIRNSYTMRVEMEESPEKPKVPDGFTIRPFRYPEEFEAAVLVEDDSFRDHFGYIEMEREDLFRLWRGYIENDDAFDPATWLVAVEDTTGEIAGICFNRSRSWHGADGGYVESLGVRRQNRKLGLARALLLSTFNLFWERGKHKVDLDVDAQSLTGATRLYEGVGMKVEKHRTTYEMVLRDGKDIKTNVLGDN